jgi:hypothetical protein
MKKTLALSFTDMPEFDFQITAMRIATGMSNHELFPDAAPMAKELNDLVDQFIHAIARARNIP